MTSPEFTHLQTQLQSQHQALTAQLAQGLVAALPLSELSDVQARLLLVNGALDAHAKAHEQAQAEADAHAQQRMLSKPNALRRHLVALTVVAALVTLAALLPMPRASFALEVEAGAAQLRMQDKGSLAGQGLGAEFRAEGFDRIESADPTLLERARDGGAYQIGMKADRLSLRRLSYPSGAMLGFEGGAPTVRIAVDGAPHSAELEVTGAVTSSFGGAPREASNYPVVEWIKLISGTAATQLWMARTPDQTLVWRGLKPVSVRWVERQANSDSEVRWVSAIRGGVLRLPSTNREVVLRSDSALELDGLRIEQADLTLGGNVGLKLSGSASRIDIDTAGFKQSLKPSLLEYAARNHSLSLFWSAAGLLWGVSTWLRKLLGDTL
jgi:hypothetical protein